MGNTYYIYIVECNKNKLYTGITIDYKRRFLEHKTKNKKAAKFTKVYDVKQIVALYKTEGRSLASKLESRIKQLDKKQKNELINNNKYFKVFFKDYFDTKLFRRINIKNSIGDRDA